MAQICKLKPGRKYPNTKQGRIMVRDPRQKIASDNFTTKEKLNTGHKLIKVNSSNKNQAKVLELGDKEVSSRRIRRAAASAKSSSSKQ